MQTSETRTKLAAVLDSIIGPSEECRPTKPGTAFERSPYRATPLKNGPRCYPFGTSFEVPRSTHAPSRGGKIVEDSDTPAEWDDHLKMRSLLMEVRVF
jgi:hypothetical protein